MVLTNFMSLISNYTPLPPRKKKIKLKTLWFSDVFRGYRKRQMTLNGLKRKIFGY